MHFILSVQVGPTPYDLNISRKIACCLPREFGCYGVWSLKPNTAVKPEPHSFMKAFNTFIP